MRFVIQRGTACRGKSRWRGNRQHRQRFSGTDRRGRNRYQRDCRQNDQEASGAADL